MMLPWWCDDVVMNLYADSPYAHVLFVCTHTCQCIHLIIVNTLSSTMLTTQGLPGCLPWGIILIYLNDFLAIPTGRNLGVHTATAVVLTNGIGGAVGVLGGGALGQWLYNRDKPAMPTVVGLGMVCAVVPMYLLINIPWAGGWVAFAFVLSFLVGILSGAPGPNIRYVGLIGGRCFMYTACGCINGSHTTTTRNHGHITPKPHSYHSQTTLISLPNHTSGQSYWRPTHQRRVAWRWHCRRCLMTWDVDWVRLSLACWCR